MKLDSRGCPLAIQNASYVANGSEAAGTRWSCVADTQTGKTWADETVAGGHPLDQVTGTLVPQANGAALCGFGDWRVPEIAPAASGDAQLGELAALYAAWQSDAGFTDEFPLFDATQGYWCAEGGTPSETSVTFSSHTIAAVDAGIAAQALLIRGVNQQPSIPGGPVHIIGTQQVQGAFTLDPLDPEGDSFTVGFKGCANNQGTLVLYQDAPETQPITLDCSTLYDAGNTPQLLSVALPIQGYFTSGPVATYSDGVAYNTAWFVFADGVSALAPVDTPVIFDERIVNQPPVVTIQGQAMSSWTVQVAATDAVTPIIQVNDVDFYNQPSDLMTAQVTLDNSQAPDVQWNLPRLQQLAATYNCPNGLVLTDTQIGITCVYNAVNELLFNISIASTDAGSYATSEQVGVNVVVNDNGNYGQCDVPELSSAPCPLSGQSNLTIIFSH